MVESCQGDLTVSSSGAAPGASIWLFSCALTPSLSFFAIFYFLRSGLRLEVGPQPFSLKTYFAMYEVDSKNLKTSLFPTLLIP